jgi:hypothetical protein
MYELSLWRQGLSMALSLLLVHAPVAAREIYKWVDERGATHFGETLPVGSVASLEVLEVRDAQVVPGVVLGDYSAILDMANRLQADRLERERLRLEREKLRLQQLKIESDSWQVNDASSPTSYYIPYYGYPRRPYPWPPYYGKVPGYPPGPPNGPRPPGRHPSPDVPKRVYLDRQ